MRNGEVIRNGSPICDEKERKTCQEGENRQINFVESDSENIKML